MGEICAAFLISGGGGSLSVSHNFKFNIFKNRRILVRIISLSIKYQLKRKLLLTGHTYKNLLVKKKLVSRQTYKLADVTAKQEKHF